MCHDVRGDVVGPKNTSTPRTEITIDLDTPVLCILPLCDAFAQDLCSTDQIKPGKHYATVDHADYAAGSTRKHELIRTVDHADQESAVSVLKDLPVDR